MNTTKNRTGWRAVRGCPGLYRVPGGGMWVRFSVGARGAELGVEGVREAVRVSERVPAGMSLAAAKVHVARLRERARRQVGEAQDDRYGIAQLVAEYFEFHRGRLREKTLAGYRRAVAGLVRWLAREKVVRVEDISVRLLEAYARGRELGRIVYRSEGRVSAGTINAEVGALRRILEWGRREWRVIATNPAAGFRRLSERGRKRGRAVLEVWEWGRLLDHRHRVNGNVAAGATQGCRHRDLWVVLGETGMRPSEIGAMEWGDVDFARRRLHVRGEKTRKSERWIPMSGRAAEALVRRLWRAGLAGEEVRGRVFRTATGGLVGRVLRDRLRRCLGAAGVEVNGRRPYSFRHFFASRLLEAGVSPRTVQELLGHSTPRMVMEVYSHVLEGDAVRAIARLDGGCLE